MNDKRTEWYVNVNVNLRGLKLSSFTRNIDRTSIGSVLSNDFKYLVIIIEYFYLIIITTKFVLYEMTNVMAKERNRIHEETRRNGCELCL